MAKLNVKKIRSDFPILRTKMNGKPFVYLDSAATSQKPIQVINAISTYYKTYNANIHRGIYKTSEKATEAYIDSKVALARLIGARNYREIVYVRNATEAINLVALSWGNANVAEGDVILTTQLEHHSNIVPWQLLAKRKGAKVEYVGLKDNAFLDMKDLKEKLEKGPKLLALADVSNVLGTINEIKRIAAMAHREGAMVLVDGAQSTPHMRVNVNSTDCDFFALSSHKMLGPSGVGALYAKEQLLEGMEPVLGGGEMVRTVGFDKSTWNDLPWKFEAGTQNIEGAIGLGVAIDYLNGIGIDNVRAHEKEITRYALKRMGEIAGVRTYGPGAKDIEKRGGIVAFSIDGIHPHDIAQVFDSEGIAIRSGHHCAMPLVTQVLKSSALARMSFYAYNDNSDVDRAVEAVYKAKKIFGK